MKAHIYHRPAVILTGSAVLLFFLLSAAPAAAQDKKQQTVTVYAAGNPQDAKKPGGVYKIKIVKDDNGKKVVIDTTVSINGQMDKEKLDELMENLEGQMENLKEQMKDLQFSVGSLDDSAVNESSGHHKAYSFRFHCNPPSQGIRSHADHGDFNYHFEIPDAAGLQDLPELMEMERNNDWNGYMRGPEIMAMPGRGGESLSDVLGNIPMCRVKSYKIIDKKGGKRIIIDLEDGIMSEPCNRMIYIHDQSHPSKPPKGMGHQKEIKVIINSDDKKDQNGGNPDQQSAPSNPEPKKSQPDKSKS